MTKRRDKPVNAAELKKRGDELLGKIQNAFDDLIDACHDEDEREEEEVTPPPQPSPEDGAGLGLTYESALRQVARLLKLAERAGTPEEAATAAAKANVLMERFQIESAMAIESLDAKERKPDEPIKHFDDDEAFDGELGKQVPHWRWRLASVVMRAHGCYGYIGTRPYYVSGRRTINGGASTIAVIGRKSDVEAARYVYRYLLAECERLVADVPPGQGKTWRNNFRSRSSGVGGAHDYSGRMAGRDAGASIHVGKTRGGIGAGSKRIK